MGVQPSMVTHWNTVNIARPMLSKEVMPELGPVHFSRQTETSGSQMKDPMGAFSSVPGKQGLAPSPSNTSISENRNRS